MSLPRLATDDQLQRIYDGALDTLESVGLLVQDDELKHLMLAAGCADGPDGQVQIPRALVEEMLAPRRAKPDVATEPARVDYEPRPGIGGQLAQFYLDPDTETRLPGSRDLLAELVRFGHAWSGGGAGPVLLCRDVPPLVEPMEAVITIGENTTTVTSAYPHTADQVAYLAEMGEILNGAANSLIGICIFLVTPLRMDLRASQLLVDLMGRGAHVWIGTQPASGASSPVTVAGTVVLGVAEILAGWTAAYILDPEAMPSGGICSGTLDMKTADVSYCAPESMLQDLLCVELFRELCGGRCSVAGGSDYTDAKRPGSQKAFEAAFEAITIWMHAGSPPGMGSGLVESGKTFSPVQFMLDHDFGRHVGRFAQGVTFTDDDLALDSIREVGLGIGRNHMATDHTLSGFRSLFDPLLLDRSARADDATEADAEGRLLARAWDEFKAVRARYEPACVGDDKLAALEAVAARAWDDLCDAPRP